MRCFLKSGFVLAFLGGLLTLNPSLVSADQAGRVTKVVQVVRSVSPAVVKIATKSKSKTSLFNTGDQSFDRLFEEFFGPMPQREESSLGSGVIIDGKRGLIVTNSHVISRASSIVVHLADRRTFKARVLGADPQSDLAVLRIKTRQPLPQVVLGNSDEMMIGETVIAIGNPFGLSHTVTTGVISALHRRVSSGQNTWLEDVVQIDASINPGNSGGPLLNVDGQVVGINTAIFRQGQGIGFAIPVNRVKRVLNDLVRHGEVIPSWLGLFLQDMTPRLAYHFGLKNAQGGLVLKVMDNSPAQRAGIKRGDLLLKVDDQILENVGHYQSWLGTVSQGTPVYLTFKTKKGYTRRKVVPMAFPMQRVQEVAWIKLGFTVRKMDPSTARRHGIPMQQALVIDKIRNGSVARKIGLEPGDLVLQIGDGATKTLAQFSRQIAGKRFLSRTTVLIRRGPYSQFVTLGR